MAPREWFYPDLPLVTLEVAFDTDPGVAPVYDDLSHLLKRYAIRRGRNQELERAQVGTLIARLDASDRRFDPTFAGELGNLVTNPSFETDLGGWFLDTVTGAHTRVFVPRFGRYAHRIAGIGAGSQYGWTAPALAGSTSGRRFLGSIYVKGEGSAIGKVFVAYFHEQGGASGTEQWTTGDSIVLDGTWQRITTKILVVRDDRTAVGFVPYLASGVAGDVHLRDGALVEEVDQPIFNPSFEIATLVDPAHASRSWWAYHSALATVARDSAQAYSGGWSLRCDVTAAEAALGASQGNIEVKPNTRYRVRVRVRGIAGRGMQLIVNEFRLLNAYEFQKEAVPWLSFAGTAGWQEITAEFTTSEQTHWLYAYVLTQGPAAAGAFWLDDFHIEELPDNPAITYKTSDYIDGDQDNSRWEGTPHASRSFRGGPYYPNVVPIRRVRVSVGDNLLPNPDFEVDGSNWAANGGSQVRNGAPGAWAQGGLWDEAGFLQHTGGFGTGPFASLVPTTPGERYTASAWVSAALGAGYRVGIQFHTGSAWIDSFETWHEGRGNDVWDRRHVTAIAPPEGVFATIYVYRTDADAGSLLIDKAQIARGGLSAYVKQVHRRFTGDVESYPEEWNGEIGYVELEAVDPLEALAAADLVNTGAWPQERSGVRLGRMLDAILWPAADRSIATGLSDVAASADYVDAADTLSEAYAVAETELGFLFADGLGRIVFQDRHHRIKNNSVVRATFGDDAPLNGELPYRDLKADPTGAFIRNDVAIDRPGGVLQRAQDEPSRLRYRRRTLSRQPRLATDTETADMAAYLLARYKDPEYRVRSLKVDMRSDPRAVPAALGLELGDRIRTVRRPGRIPPPIDRESHIEAMNEDFDGAAHTVELALSPADVQAYWVLDSPANSVLGVSTRLAY